MNYYSHTAFWKRWFRQFCKDVSSKIIVENKKLYTPTEGTYFIYALKCPFLRKVFYVGKTRDIMQRIRCHAWENQTTESKVHKFCKSITRRRMKVKVLILKRCLKKTSSRNEELWIKYFSRKGHPLLNIHHAKNKSRKSLPASHI